MFQFPEFPTHTYVFSGRFMTLRHEGFPIRISTDRSLFAAPRSFSQLITSFFGSWCQGIHLMLFFAWTFLFLGSRSFFELLEFHKTNNLIRLLILFLWKGFILLFFELFSTFRWNCNLPLIFLERPLNLTNLLIKSFCLCPLICSFLTLQIYFIRFSMNVWWAQTRITLQRTAYLYAEHWSASGLIPRLSSLGGLKWTRTTDLALIRRAL